MGQQNPELNDFFKNAKKWKDELILLRSIVLETALTEEKKWYQPCYTFLNKNVLILSGFKDYCSVNFFKGSLLKDPKGLLIQQTKNMQATRQLRYTNVEEIEKQKSIIKAFIKEAINLEKKGEKVPMKTTAEFEIPQELKDIFKTDSEFKSAFKALSPGRQRGYLLLFGAAKQSATRLNRILKYRERIFAGKGYQD